MRGLRSIFLLAAGSLVLGFLFVRSTALDPDVHYHFARDLQLLESLDTRLDQDVLRARYGLLQHYDGIASDLSELRGVRARVDRIPDFLAPEARDSVRAAALEYEGHALRKEEQIERFKTANAAVKNSLRYFPIAARELVHWVEEQRLGVEFRESSRELLESVLHYELSSETAEGERALRALERLEALRTDASGMPQDALVHARNIISRKAQLDSGLRELLAMPTHRAAMRLERVYSEAYTQAQRASQVFRRLLYLGAILMIGWVSYSVAALRRAKLALEVSNQSLDRRVRERTRELEDAKEQLEADSRALTALNAELERSNGELDDFAYIASHDLKEPLRGIHNYAAFLIEDYAERIDDEGRQKLETLGKLARRMDGLIDSLLYYSRVGRTDLAYGEVSLQEVLEEVVESLQVSIEERGAEVRIPRELPVVYCDRARVGEIFRNLVTNALKYNDKAEKWIEVGFRAPGEDPGERGAGSYVYTVRDNGIGIREKNLDSIFRIFKRLHGRDKYGGGTGAGLTIVKKIVERHGGEIWVTSTPGEGTTFHFTLGEKTGG